MATAFVRCRCLDVERVPTLSNEFNQIFAGGFAHQSRGLGLPQGAKPMPRGHRQPDR